VKTDNLLEVKDLSVWYRERGDRLIRAVSKASLEVRSESVTAIVGESGSGKSTLVRALVGLAGSPHQVVQEGKMRFEDRSYDLASIPSLAALRGSKMAFIFQEPSTVFNPVFRIGHQIVEAVRLHHRKATAPSIEHLLQQAGLGRPDRIARAYPHELSGGMLQRAVLAMALACQPTLLIADEPTTALDVTTQKRILDHLRQLTRQSHLTLLLITHNLALVSRYADRMVVMRGGKILEAGAVDTVLSRPESDYTRQLLECLPRLGDRRRPLPTLQDVH